MTSLDGCTADEIRELADWTGRLKHDLGKYIRFRQGWLEDDASIDDRRSAVIADVHHTRRGPAGSVAAQDVWAEFRDVLLGDEASLGLDDRRLDAIDDAMRELASLEPLDSANAEAIRRAEALCVVVADSIRELARDARVRFLANG